MNPRHTEPLVAASPPPHAQIHHPNQLSPFQLPRHVIAFVPTARSRSRGFGVFAVVDNDHRYLTLEQTAQDVTIGSPRQKLLPRGALKVRPEFARHGSGMHRKEFEHFRISVKARGFDRVLTLGGLVPVGEWRPWGVFRDPAVEHERFYGGLHWMLPNFARDVPMSIRWIALGVWTFLVEGSLARSSSWSVAMQGPHATSADFPDPQSWNAHRACH